MATPTDSVPISHHFHALNKLSSDATASSDPILLFFVNGLMLPQLLWQPTLTLIEQTLAASPLSALVSAITYDRYGQGKSIRTDDPSWTPQPHDLLSAAKELDQQLSELQDKYFTAPTIRPKIIIVAHSIGVPLARLHNQHYPSRIHGYVFLDSNIANSDFVSILPDPEISGFTLSDLPDDCMLQELEKTRSRLKGMFHPSIPNSEGLDRRNLRELLPHSNKPLLSPAPDGKLPYLTVVGHDPAAFAEEGYRLNGTPKGLNVKYLQPAWDEYNQGLLGLTEKPQTKGVVIAKGAGHFIQRDNPTCVAEEIIDMISNVTKGG